MTDKIGVLGEATVVTTGLTSVYVVPSGKAAKVKIMYWGQNAAGAATFVLTINGVPVVTTGALSASNYFWSSTVAQQKASATAPPGTTTADTVAPGPGEYYLSAGDIVSYTIGVATITSLNVQVVGAEVDAA